LQLLVIEPVIEGVIEAVIEGISFFKDHLGPTNTRKSRRHATNDQNTSHLPTLSIGCDIDRAWF
jgi:hypothetical protein